MNPIPEMIQKVDKSAQPEAQVEETFESKINKIKEAIKNPDQAHENIWNMLDSNFKDTFKEKLNEAPLKEEIQKLIVTMENLKPEYLNFLEDEQPNWNEERNKDQESLQNLMTFLWQYKESDLVTTDFTAKANWKELKYNNNNQLINQTKEKIKDNKFNNMPWIDEIKKVLKNPTQENIGALQKFVRKNFPNNNKVITKKTFLEKNFKLNADWKTRNLNIPDGKFWKTTNEAINVILDEYMQLQTSNLTAQTNTDKFIKKNEDTRQQQLAINNLPAEERYKFDNAKEWAWTTLDIEWKWFKYAKVNGNLFSKYDPTNWEAQYRKLDLKKWEWDNTAQENPIESENMVQQNPEAGTNYTFAFEKEEKQTWLTYIDSKNLPNIFDTPKAKEVLWEYKINRESWNRISIKSTSWTWVSSIMFKKWLEETLKDAGVKNLAIEKYKLAMKGDKVDSFSFDIGEDSVFNEDQLKFVQAPENKWGTISSWANWYKYIKMWDTLYAEKDNKFIIYNNKPNDWTSLWDENKFKLKLAELAGKNNRSSEIEYNNWFKFQYAQVNGNLVSKQVWKQVWEKPVFQKFDAKKVLRKDFWKLDPFQELNKLKLASDKVWEKIDWIDNWFEYIKNKWELYSKAILADNAEILFLKYNKENNTWDKAENPVNETNNLASK